MRSRLFNPVALTSVFLSVLFFAANAHALTLDEIIRLVEAGVEDRTIQMLMQQEKADREGNGGVGVREIKRPDGRKDIIYTSVSTPEEVQSLDQQERMKMDRALEILNRVEIYHQR